MLCQPGSSAENQRTSCEVKSHSAVPVSADDLASAGVGPLHEIEMKLGPPALRKSQINPGRILDVHLQTAEMLGAATHFRRPAQQPADVVQFVRAVENDAAAKLFARAVALAIVLPRPPIGRY